MTGNCSYIKPDGNQCRAYSLKVGEFCFQHSPEKAAERKEASARGGRSTTRAKEVLIETLIGEVVQEEEDKGNKLEIHNLEDLKNWILREMKYTEDNKVYGKLSQADRIIQLRYAEFLFKVLLLGYIEPRMQEIEAILNSE